MDIEAETSRVDAFLRERLSGKRYRHSVGTALTARDIAERAGANAPLAYLAGLAHDIGRVFDDDTQAVLCEEAVKGIDARGEVPLSASIRCLPALRHGPAGALALARDFGIDDPRIAEALRWHSTGRGGMGTLARIVYVADKIEPGREYLPAGFRETCLSSDLDRMTALVLGRSFAEFREKGKAVAPESLSLYDSLTGKQP